jgi:sortase A
MTHQGAKHALPSRKRILWRLALIIGGAALAGWAFLVLQPSAPPQATAIGGLTQLELEERATTTPPDSPGAPSDGVSALYPSYLELGERLGTLTLPSLDLSWPIFEGTTEDQLSQGVGHFSGSVLPGMPDNSVLSGHRTTVFGSLGDLAEGDLIYVTTIAGEFTYQVTMFRIVNRTDETVIVPTPQATLTLTTCYPFHSFLGTTEAFVVSAVLVHSLLAEP